MVCEKADENRDEAYQLGRLPKTLHDDMRTNTFLNEKPLTSFNS